MEITVGMGEIRIAESPQYMMAVGIGSCVVVTLYDRAFRRGGLAHIVLPYREETHDKSHPVRFTDVSINMMIDEMMKRGSRTQDMKAKIFGGANMFPEIIASDSIMDVGRKNIMAAREELKGHNIEILAEEVGDQFGRTVLFDTKDGSVIVKTACLGERKY